MCRKVSCSVCGKATWAGCGNHIQSALAGTPMDQRCCGWQTGRCSSQNPPTSVPKYDMKDGACYTCTKR